MTYIFLASVFFLSLALLVVGILVCCFSSAKYRRSRKIKAFYILWFACYGVFILFFTGPENLAAYPPAQGSPYKLPWKNGARRFVAQGNRSFTSHRDFHNYAWDFLMPNGTEILAARDGKVVEIEENWDGIGIKSNFLTIEHTDGTRAVYAHIRHRAALVKVGEVVQQGQSITYSGMVGQTIYPHVHFYVIDKEGTGSMPIAFSDVPGGIPFAGKFYTSENSTQ
jgi:murein DD-endopeptidase MepM/ murein hydrolase activator NlpD